MPGTKNAAAAVALYAAVAVALVSAIGVGAAVLAAHVPVIEPVKQDKSPLQARLDSAREVKEALAKPVPPPEPLGPISSKLKPPSVAKVAEVKTELKPKARRAVPQGREAFARFEPLPEPFFQLFAFGPR